MTSTISTAMDDQWSNETVVVGPSARIEAMKLAHKIVLSSILLFIMLAMGCTITPKDIKDVIRVPKSVLIGMVCQFVLMPLTGFCLALALALPAHYAIGVLVISCCPGGTVSNLFTFWANGDVCLSICMTTISTVVAIGMMPFNLFIYSRVWTSDRAVIPFVSIVISLISILIPVAIGMIIRWRRKQWTKLISQVASILGLLGIITSITLTAIIRPSIYRVGWRVWLCILLLPSLGATFGYALASLFRRPAEQSRTIAYETGLQNVSLAITLILLTFKDTPELYLLLVYPSLYGPCMMFEGFISVFVYKLVSRYRDRKWTRASEENDLDDCGCEENLKSLNKQ